MESLTTPATVGRTTPTASDGNPNQKLFILALQNRQTPEWFYLRFRNRATLRNGYRPLLASTGTELPV
jgi:hypothetical protein